jgi:hypothetical protein
MYGTDGSAHTIGPGTSWNYPGGSYTIYNSYEKFDPSYPNSSKSGVVNFAPNYAVDGKTGKTYQNDAYVKGEIHATSGSFSGTVNASGSFRVVNSNNQSVVKIQAGTHSTDNPGETYVTILDEAGLYSRQNSDGFRMTSRGLQRYDGLRGSWMPMFARRVVESLGNPSTTAAQTLYVQTYHDFVLIQNIGNNADVYLPAPATAGNGKIYTLVAMGGKDRKVFVRINGSGKFHAGDAETYYLEMNNYEQATFVAYGNYWFATNSSW